MAWVGEEGKKGLEEVRSVGREVVRERRRRLSCIYEVEEDNLYTALFQ